MPVFPEPASQPSTYAGIFVKMIDLMWEMLISSWYEADNVGQIISQIKSGFQFVPQHFLYFLPLPHGQGSLRPNFSDWAGKGGFNAFSKSEISSGLSASRPM